RPRGASGFRRGGRGLGNAERRTGAAPGDARPHRPRSFGLKKKAAKRPPFSPTRARRPADSSLGPQRVPSRQQVTHQSQSEDEGREAQGRKRRNGPALWHRRTRERNATPDREASTGSQRTLRPLDGG